MKLGPKVVCDKTFLAVYWNMTLTLGQGHKLTLNIPKNELSPIDYSQQNDETYVVYGMWQALYRHANECNLEPRSRSRDDLEI